MLLLPNKFSIFSFFSIPAITKVHGAHLKASAAMVRLRLYDILALLPPKTYEGNANTSACFQLEEERFGGSFNSRNVVVQVASMLS